MEAKLEVNGAGTPYPQDIYDLENLLLFTKKNSLSEGELVVEVKVDGEVFSEDYDHQARSVDLGKTQKVEIITQTKEVFAKNFLLYAPDILLHVKRGFRSAAELLLNSQEEEGNDLLGRSLETLLAFKSHLDNVKDILKNEDTQKHSRVAWDKFIRLADKIIESQEEGDTVAIAGLLEEEMIPFLDKWKEAVS